MKTWKKITGGIILAGVLVGTMWMLSQYMLHAPEEETETTRQIQGPPVQKRPEYQIGDSIQVTPLVWKVTNVELIEEYEGIAETDLKEGNFVRREDLREFSNSNWQLMNLPYVEEDIRFLKVEYTITNTSEEIARMVTPMPQLLNKKSDEYGRWYPSARIEEIVTFHTSDTVGVVEESFTEVRLEAQDTLNCTYLAQYSEAGDGYDVQYISDLYMAVPLDSSGAGGIGAGNAFVKLNITGNHQQVSKTTIADAYENQRNFPLIKANMILNVDLKQYQKEGYPIAYEKGDKEIPYYLEEDIVGADYEFDVYLKSRIDHYQVLSWTEFTETNTNYHEGLKNMAESYHTRYGCGAEKLRVLLVDYTYSIPEDKEMDRKFCLYDNTILFTRDSAGKRWIFGYADDLWVVKGSMSENFGQYPACVWMQSGDSITIQAAYILPPELYEKENALYFAGGQLRENNITGEPVVELKLR